jgi:DNA polymerase elongation subunit (family B)
MEQYWCKNTIEEAEKLYTLLVTLNPLIEVVNIQLDYENEKYSPAQQASLAFPDGNEGRYIFTTTKSLPDPMSRDISKQVVPISLDLKLKCVAGDTDSCMIMFTFNRKNDQQNHLDTFKLSHICAKQMTLMFDRYPIEMEFEKVFRPFLLVAKKNYIGFKYDDMKNPLRMTKQDNKGIALVRRNYNEFCKSCYSQIVHSIVNESIETSIMKFKQFITLLATRQVPIEQLVITKLLKDKYKSTSQVHVHLSERMKKRGEDVSVGDRIPFVIIEPKSKLEKAYERGETLDFIKQNNLSYDIHHYIDHVSKPIITLYETVLSSEEIVKLKKELKLCVAAAK